MKNTFFTSILLLAAVMFISSLKYDLFEISKQLEIYNTVFKNININYVDETDPAKLTKIGVSEILSSLDPYTVYSSENDVEKAKIDLVGGIFSLGASISYIKNELTILKVNKKSSADLSGLKPGDIITKINNISVDNPDSMVDVLLLGKKDVILSFMRNGVENSVVLRKKNNKIKSVPTYKILNNKTGYIALTKFTKGAAKEVESALKFLMVDEINGLILDLRDNPGGLLNEAVDVVNLFVEKDELVVYTKSNNDKYNQQFVTKKQPLNTDIPVAVLINEQSASASEIVAGSLQDLDRAVIIGKQSFGKGLVQNIASLPYGGQMKITVSKYYTPSGRCIQSYDYANSLKTGVTKRFEETQTFTTKNGRVVYNNAGIIPDIKVGVKSKFDIIKEIKKDNLLFRFAVNFCRKNNVTTINDIKIKKETFNDFMSFYFLEKNGFETKTEKTIALLKNTAKDEGLFLIDNEIKSLNNIIKKEKKEAFEKLEKEIIQLLKNKIFEIVFYNKDFSSFTLKNDFTIEKAVSVLSSFEVYYSFLK